PTNPNRCISVAGTSQGHGSNDATFDVSGITIPSIFQQVDEKGLSWKNYGSGGDATYFEWVQTVRPSNVVPIGNFFTDAAAGALPT
ncbi:hypothetical protein DXG01_017125, partial [Tephrocybe rancida]